MQQQLRLRSRHNSKCSIWWQPAERHCFTSSPPWTSRFSSFKMVAIVLSQISNFLFLNFCLLTLTISIFKIQSAFHRNWIVKKVALVLNGFFIHNVQTVHIFCWQGYWKEKENLQIIFVGKQKGLNLLSIWWILWGGPRNMFVCTYCFWDFK